MPNVLIWARARDLVPGDLPPGLNLERVASLDELKRRADATGGSLVLLDPPTLAEHGAQLAEWAGHGRRRGTLLVAVADAADADELLRTHKFLDDILLRPVTRERLRVRVERAIDLAHSLRMVEQLEAAIGRKSAELHELNKIGVALSAERDIDALLKLILLKCREITAADAGSLYLVERGTDDEGGDKLRFKLTQNDSLVLPFEEFTMPLNQTSISGYAALTGSSVNVADAYHLPPDSPYTISRSFDEKSGYRTKSMLVVPMRDHQDDVIGVVQLINKKRDAKAVLRPVSLVEEMVVPFTAVDEELVNSLASQAAVAFENTRLIQDIRNLFESFVRASVTAIEARDPTTSGHSERVATLTTGLATVVDSLDDGPFREVRFTRDQLEELRYASLLHDFGKVGVREKVLIKGKKLYVGEMLVVRQRFAYIKRSLEAEHLRARLEQLESGGASPELMAQMEKEFEERRAESDRVLAMILKANEPSILEEESFRALMDLPSRTFPDIEGNPQPLLTPNEVAALSIRRGSLSEKERREIESHVTHTYRFLSQIPWTGEFAAVPDIAYAHHEKLDGSGYPRQLTASGIPVQSKMMTISDIYDALVAWDRPYKKAVPVTRALDILNEEASQGKLDKNLLALFVDAKVFEQTLPKTGQPTTA